MLGSLFRRYADLSFSLKLIISFLFGAIIWSLFLAFLSNYATYYFAFRHGARLPIEGVPFLALSVAILGFLAFSISTGGAVIVYIVLRILTYPLRFFLPDFESIERTFFSRLLNGVVVIFALWSAAIFAIWQFGSPLTINPMAAMPYYGAGIIIGIAGVTLYMYPAYLNRTLSVLYILITLTISTGLFIEGTYDAFLRWIRFGGGIEISISTKDKTTATGYLFLMTYERAMLYDSANNEFMEIPVHDIDTYKYAQYPNWKLPSASLQSQRKYAW